MLVLDIEWRPVKAYVWRAWDESVQPDQIIEDGGLLCVGCKWVGGKTELFSEWEHGKEGMLAEVHERMSYADCIIGFNSAKYDEQKLDGEFLKYGLPPRPPCTSIDLIKTIKKMGFFRNSLAYIGPFLGVGAKMEHEGFKLWKGVMDGDPAAQKRMGKYCIQDVDVTEALYLRIRSHIRNHPHMGQTGHAQCPSCGGDKVHSRGTRRTRAYKIQRLNCQNPTCNHWFDGARTKI